MKHGKKYQEAAKAIDRMTQYDVAEAFDLVQKSATAKFDETVEVHIRTGCDGRHADQQIRGAVVLDLTGFDLCDCLCNIHGNGASLRVRHKTFRS